jgi:4-hydroxythreonine-4-phosphate dehydrogenase
MNNLPLILLTPGEPAGIGPDLVLQAAQQEFAAEIIVVADSNLLRERAKKLALPLSLLTYDPAAPKQPQQPGYLKIIDVPAPIFCEPGKPDSNNAAYIIKTLTIATQKCLSGEAAAIVTGPVNKAIINKANIPFQGHTEFFAALSQVKDVVMLFVSKDLKVALVTTHLPLKEVAKAITKDRLRTTLSILLHEFPLYFANKNLCTLVCGLNPHAGENGYLGTEEIEIISPVIQEFVAQGKTMIGPLPADTIFTEKYRQQADIIVAMYHDQGLPVVKYQGFSNAVNVTLGLPFIRTSVDHGTAFDLAGTGKADAGSLILAIETAIEMANKAKK